MSSETKATPKVTAARDGQNGWRRRYALMLCITDFLVLVWVVFGVQIAWVGFDQEAVGVSGSRGDIAVSYTLISITIIVSWMAALASYGSRSDRVVGVGFSEYKLIANASFHLFGAIAIIAFILKIDLARGYILMALPIGVMVLLASRWIWRQWLGVQRQRGDYSSKVLLVGSEESVKQIAKQLIDQPQAGYQVVGACVPTGRVGDTLPGTAIPISGSLALLTEALEVSGADTVIITSSDELSPDRVKRLSWSLEPGRQHLVVAPSLTGTSGPRIHTRPVAGFPLIHVETPRYDGAKLVSKRILDVVASVTMLLLLVPVFLIISVAIKSTSPGPVFFRQDRVGINGKHFGMLKFRSMAVDAESRLAELGMTPRDAGNQVLFKMRNDPRVTQVGRFLRRFSLDELPQLLNVLRGSMSLVGPRPPLEGELSAYEEHVHRRFLVKPGITGLWQVSGRSNLSWEDSVRLDLYYVENWSTTGDLMILWRTFRAVLGSQGAY